MRKNTYIDTEAADKGFFYGDGLSADEERELSKLILAGEAAKKTLSNTDGLSVNEKLSLQRTAEEGDRAYDRLVLANVPRAVKIAAETFRKNPHGLNGFEDYQQAAMKVICSCARTFDWKLGCRFGTYVHRCLQHEMMRENAVTGYALRIPEERLSEIASLKRMSKTGELADAVKDSGMARSDADRLLLAASISRSLQDPVSGEDPDTDLGDMIADPAAMTAEEIEARIDREASLKRARAAFSALSAEEKTLLSGRLGFDGEPQPMRVFVGTVANSISSVQKKQLAAEKHLREIYFSLPLAD